MYAVPAAPVAVTITRSCAAGIAGSNSTRVEVAVVPGVQVYEVAAAVKAFAPFVEDEATPYQSMLLLEN